MAEMTFASVLPSLLGGLAASAIGTMMKDDSAPATPLAQAPAVEKPTTMPTPNDAEQRAAQRRSLAQQAARRGRASTILTDQPDSKLGG